MWGLIYPILRFLLSAFLELREKNNEAIEADDIHAGAGIDLNSRKLM